MKLFLLLTSVSVVFCYSQEKFLNDSIVELNTVDIIKNRVFSAGHLVTEYAANQAEFSSSTTLGQALNRTTAIPFKNYGNGMLSSISTRGLTAAHTAVLWEGLPINSSLNGQSDLNLFASQSFDEVNFRSGGGSALFGSGAVGGSLQLINPKKYNQQFRIHLLQGLGSFGLSNSSIKTSWGNKNLYVNGSFQYLYSKNNYDFTNLFGNEVQVNNGRISLANFSANVGYQFQNQQELKLSVWNTYGNRNIPERSTQPNSNQNQKDQQTRLSLQYNHPTKNGKHNIQVAWLKEDYSYKENKDKQAESVNGSDNVLGTYNWFYQLPHSYHVNLGILANFANAKGTNLVDAKRADWTVFAALSKQFNQKLKASATLHKGFSTAFDIPFTVDFGVDYKINKHHTIKSNFTSNYRTPTLNDLFWLGAGNANLKPESGWMWDVTHALHHNKWLDVKLTNTFFYGNFADWIQWLPNANSGIFMPQNIDAVTNYGIETNASLSKELNQTFFDFRMGYQWINAQRQDNQSQLIYTPKHRLNAALAIKHKAVGLRYEANYTSKSYYTSDESSFLNPFWLFNLAFNTNLKLANKPVFFEFTVFNLFDQAYETIRGYPMPKRYFNTTFQIQL